ncbi:hypothetical protein [Pelagicoccus sp. SDUM812003]|nr:hypothetical protein [Pelagicoccus sp. SDUM812003]MDQ8204946.1 hypothetical protein [Pelagicoccus sp. SDUM812003]
MSAKSSKSQPGQEQYAYAVTRKLFNFTLVGTVLFSIVIVVLWYVF